MLWCSITSRMVVCATLCPHACTFEVSLREEVVVLTTRIQDGTAERKAPLTLTCPPRTTPGLAQHYTITPQPFNTNTLISH